MNLTTLNFEHSNKVNLMNGVNKIIEIESSK